MTINNDITNNHIVNILNQNITIPIAIGMVILFIVSYSI